MNEFYELLKKKRIQFNEITHWGPLMRERWADHFAKHLDADEQERINMRDDRYFCGYYWHVFSYETLPHLSRIEANQAFEQADKSSCIVFFQHDDAIYKIANAKDLTAEDLLDFQDIYIVDENLTWTYVVTHGKDCGPYFTQKGE